MADILKDLTPEQREAVTHLEGPMLVVAGAGSGKTRVVTRRIAYLIERGVWPNQILAMTFTNKAANEMKERVETLAGAAPRWISTFHSACARFLRRDIEKLDGDGRTSQYTIYDTSDQLTVIKRCMKRLGLSQREVNPSGLRSGISSLKCKLNDDLDEVADLGSQCLSEVYGLYEHEMRELNAVDFDDLLLLTVRLLESNAALREVYQTRFRYLLIDEYQDTNRVQYVLMKLLTGARKNVHVTGDPDQSIYSWRGAEYRNIMDFTRDFPDARVVRLERNYRSTKHILSAANELIGNNVERIEKVLFTDKYDGPPVTVMATENDRGEANWVVERMLELQAENVSLRDVAVFYRTNAQSRPIEDALMDRGIPYQVVGGLRFYERREIKDILAHLQILINPRDSVALQRVIGCRSTGVGDKTFERILELAAESGKAPLDVIAAEDFADRFTGRVTKKLLEFADWCRELQDLPKAPVGDAIYRMIQHSQLADHYGGLSDKDPLAENRVDNLNALIDRGYEVQMQQPDATLDQFLEQVALVSDIDYHDEKSECVSLMTFHASKGLEFPYVFIVGVEEEYLPHKNTVTSPKAIEEERRLFYVGITRAQEAVYILHAKVRHVWGDLEARMPSRFLRELPDLGVDREHAEREQTQSAWFNW